MLAEPETWPTTSWKSPNPETKTKQAVGRPVAESGVIGVG